MDKNNLTTKLNEILPGLVLEVRLFGRSGVSSIWVEGKSVQKAASLLKENSEFRLDWLENLSVVEFEKALVLSYFLRSNSSSQTLVMRASVVPSSANEEPVFPSIRSVWSMGEFFEEEIQELFGIRFEKESGEKYPLFSRLLVEGSKGFPLRKNYVFPAESGGIQHARLQSRAQVVTKGV